MDASAALVEQDRLFAELLGAADVATPVPTCPEWTLRQLLTHVGRGHRWAATIVRERADARVDIRTVADGKPPVETAAAVEWLTESSRTLLDAVAATGSEVSVWTLTGPQRVDWWVRRRLHESVVHRADAAIALGEAFVVDAGLAADGLSEWLGLLSARPAGDTPVLADGATLHLHATDDGLGGDGEWVVRTDAGRVVWERGHGRATVAVRGRAADLLLAALRRLPADDPRLEVLGDAPTWRRWLESTPF